MFQGDHAVELAVLMHRRVDQVVRQPALGRGGAGSLNVSSIAQVSADYSSLVIRPGALSPSRCFTSATTARAFSSVVIDNEDVVLAPVAAQVAVGILEAEAGAVVRGPGASWTGP